MGGEAHPNNFPADVFLYGGSSQCEGSLQCPSFLALAKKRADTLGRSRAASCFSAWRRRLRHMRRWAEPEQAGTLKQLIARMIKQNSRPALRAWFGTPGIKDAWPGAAGCGLAPERTEYAFALSKGASDEKLPALVVAGPRRACRSAPVGDIWGRRIPGLLVAGILCSAPVRMWRKRTLFCTPCPVVSSHVNSWRMHERRCQHL